MQNAFVKQHYESLLSRLQQINAASLPLWGKMNAAQMMHHLNISMKVALGKIPPKAKSNFFTRLLKGVAYNDKPWGKGAPTPKEFKVTGDFDFEKEKQETIAALSEVFQNGTSFAFKPHVFFGPLSGEQWGMHFYKHIDHHLKQFGV